MSIRYAILGLLAQTPRHGYEIKQDFESSFSGMRQLNAGQIYTALARLGEEKLVSMQTVEQFKAPAKKIYSLTEKGQQALQSWLETPVENNFEQVRSEFFLKLLVHALIIGSQDNRLSAVQMIEQQRQEFQKSLDEMRRTRLRLTVVTGPGAFDPRSPDEQEASEIQLLLIEGAILHLEADLEWLRLIETRLDRLQLRRSNPLWQHYHQKSNTNQGT